MLVQAILDCMFNDLQTILLVPVVPHGVVQLGSIELVCEYI